MALQPSALDRNNPYPESDAVREREADIQASMKRAAKGVGIAAGAALATWLLARKR